MNTDAKDFWGITTYRCNRRDWTVHISRELLILPAEASCTDEEFDEAAERFVGLHNDLIYQRIRAASPRPPFYVTVEPRDLAVKRAKTLGD